MSVIVRFAPSPTGKLHVGNVRTALMNWLFAKSQGGKFILRIDDTDLERSTNAYEDGIKTDLNWLGLTWDETFNQSHRFKKYEAASAHLITAGLLYPCYETSEELDRQRKLQRVQSKPPIYNRAALDLTSEQIDAYKSEGRKPHWRFKLSGHAVTWTDMVRGAAGITHVIRGEDHVTNSGAQIEIFNALIDYMGGGSVPTFAHTPLLVGKDGKGLSKRLGSLSMDQLRDQSFEPLAICSLLGKIGTSDAIEARLLNGRLLNATDYDAVKAPLSEMGIHNAEALWTLMRSNIQKVSDMAGWATVVNAPMPGQIADEDVEFCKIAAAALPETITDQTWSELTTHLKEVTGRKGKSLFMPLRMALTGRPHGPEMGAMLSLLGADKAKARLNGDTG